MGINVSICELEAKNAPCKDLKTKVVKALVEDGRFDYLETGSLISIKKNVENIVIPSEEDGIDMYPMDFEEFLWAMGNEVMMPYIRKQFDNQKSPIGF